MKKILVLVLLASLVTTGCAINIYKKSPKAMRKIEDLSGEVAKLSELRAREREEFERIKKELKRKLKGKVGLALAERGLVITLANNILFDSGKARIKNDAGPILGKIANVIKNRAPDKNIGIEGHTDNIPIKYSSWKSNRELSTARANNVYHYLVDRAGLTPSKLRTIGYGQFRPIAGNNTAAGRAKNRRVEIVILPRYPRKPIGELEKERWVK
jgi:chemotaxis protein MotB